jgi:hypothetical protein
MIRFISCLLLIAPFAAIGTAQEPPTVTEFFQQRLNGAPRPSSAEALVAVINPILQSDPKTITGALPSIDAALTSDKDELPGEAILALFTIARRADGAVLLRSRIPEIEALLLRPEEPLRNGAVLVLQTLTPSDPNLTAPVMIRFLNSSAKASPAKVETVWTLLQYRRQDPAALQAIQHFLSMPADPDLRMAILQTLTRDRVNTPVTDDCALHALSDPDPHVKVVAVHTVHALGPEVWQRALATVSNLAVDSAEDRAVRDAADKELKNTLPDTDQGAKKQQQP